jgi:hypothetical protein
LNTLTEEDGDLLYTTGDKSIRLFTWNEDNKNRAEAYKEQKQIINNRDQTRAETLKTFEFSDEEISRLGFMIKEQDGNKSYNVIHGVSIVDNQFLRLALYFDKEKDLDWALETWKNIKKL